MTDEGPTDRTDLSDLLRDRKGRLGLGLRELAAACVDPKDPDRKPQYPPSTLGNLINGVLGTKGPTRPQLRALAQGFRLPLGQVQEAAGAQFFGIDTVWSEDAEVRALVHGYRDMSPEDQAWVRDIIESRRTRPV
ncbi:helix-turn-helix domain-containing protein [Streptomyces graminilatus]|uniref:helix-turn-helix domain-containing protein n=1 Tax=Streptomyces graminilatus TaxID=1464070 RepID=UPI0006E30BD7|nr:helix-turn-helix domain-containing protein [Streptomyces graminilatus]